MWISIVVLLILVAPEGRCACPASCSCSGNNMTCAGLTSIPDDIQKNVTNLKLTSMNLTEIPSDLFIRFESLKSFQISDSIIGKIRPFAFSRLNGTDIMFIECLIGSLESYAISTIEFFGKLKFHNCTIAHLNQSAISNIDYLGTIEFFESKIREFRPMAVSDVRYINTVTMYKCNLSLLREKAFSNIGVLKTMIIASSYMETVDSFAFSNITELGQIQFVQSSVSDIKSYAFTQIGKIGTLGAYQSNFTIIRRKAISNNSMISTFSWTFSKIDVLESYAVSNNTQFTTLSFYKMHIGHFQSFALNDTTLKYADFQYIIIDQLDCGTIEQLKDTVAVRLTFKPVSVTCNNNICWMFHPNRTKYLRVVFKDVRCSTSLANVTSGLGSLADMPSETLPFDCGNYDYTANFTCSRSSRSWERDVIKTVVLGIPLMTFAWLTRLSGTDR